VRLLVVLVVTVALLVAATPLALTQLPRLHSPLLAGVAFGVAAIALVAGVALLLRATAVRRRASGDGAPGPGRPARRGAVAARVVPSPRRAPDQGLQPPADESATDPRPGHEHIVLVPTGGRLTVSASAPGARPRHALVGHPARRQSRQDPSSAGQSPTGPSHTQAQQSSPTGSDDPDAATAAAATERSAAFAARYTATRSRR
jgi:hypothetical protein